MRGCTHVSELAASLATAAYQTMAASACRILPKAVPARPRHALTRPSRVARFYPSGTGAPSDRGPRRKATITDGPLQPERSRVPEKFSVVPALICASFRVRAAVSGLDAIASPLGEEFGRSRRGRPRAARSIPRPLDVDVVVARLFPRPGCSHVGARGSRGASAACARPMRPAPGRGIASAAIGSGPRAPPPPRSDLESQGSRGSTRSRRGSPERAQQGYVIRSLSAARFGCLQGRRLDRRGRVSCEGRWVQVTDATFLSGQFHQPDP